MRSVRKTRKMLQAEERLGGPLAEHLPALLQEHTLEEAARILGVSKATLGYWMLKRGIRVVRVVLRPGDVLVLRRDGWETVISE